MKSKGKRPCRTLTPSDKLQAIQRIHNGETKASVARDIQVPESTLRGWFKNEDKLRYMERQSGSNKTPTDALSHNGRTALFGSSNSPPLKRQKLESSVPFGFPHDHKFSGFPYNRSPINALDFTGKPKTIPEIGFPDFGTETKAFKNSDFPTSFGGKSKFFGGADLSRQSEPSLAEISPFQNFSNLYGLNGLSQSQLAFSFNELTSNLNLIAKLNPNLAAISGFNNNNNVFCNPTKDKPPPQSPISESDKISQSGISVKNWAKQKHSSPNDLQFSPQYQQQRPNSIVSSENIVSSNISPENKVKMKSPSPPINREVPLEDPLLCWLKSQHAMLGLANSPPTPTPNPISSYPHMRPALQPMKNSHDEASEISQILKAQQISSSLSAAVPEESKNLAWLNWCKALGANLSSMSHEREAATPVEQKPAPQNISRNGIDIKSHFENILYSHLNKNPNTIENDDDVALAHHQSNKPEDLSAKSTESKSSRSSSPIGIIKSEADTATNCSETPENLHFKLRSDGSESVMSYNSDSLNNNNNNNDENKIYPTDENDENYLMSKYGDEKMNENDVNDMYEALEHGEKFLKWLENCRNPRLQFTKMLKLRLLITKIFELD